MLQRAALRSIRPFNVTSSRLRPAPTPIVCTALRIRSYASSKSPRAPPPPASRPAPMPAPKGYPTRSARQTSPGTSIPKDQTWKPQDRIKLSGTPDVAGAAATPIQGARTTDSASTQSPLEHAAAEKEPVAHSHNADTPLPGDARDVAQEKVDESENTPSPQQPAPPLPDLRQGIPSTFDFEFGAGKASARESKTPSDSQDIELAPSQSDGPRERTREEREYDGSAYETSIDRKRRQMVRYLYGTVLLGTALTGAYLSRPFDSAADVPAGLPSEDASGWTLGKMYARVRARFGSQAAYYTEPVDTKLLPEVPESQRAPFTLVLSLEDLLIHTTWDRTNGYRVAKRPGVDYFIRYLSQYYELVLFTSVPRAMADPVIAKLDPYHFIMWPLGREATKFEGGEIVKDLSYLNRPLNKTLIIDTHAPHVRNQPENAIVIPKWSGDPKDPHTKDLVALIPFLESVATMGTEDVRTVLASFSGRSIPEEFARREGEARKRFEAQLEVERSRRPKFSLGSVASSLGVKGGAGMGGGMVLADGQSVAEGLAKGKMLSDQIREQGQKQYEALEKQIREHGEQWLKDEAEENRKAMENQMKEMKQGAMSWFGGPKK